MIDLGDLPPSPPGRSGWPWTGADLTAGPVMNAERAPRITLVTPSYGQGDYLEATIRSVLLQGYPNLEYIVIDGGSTDGSHAILETYSPWLSYWVSEPDRGQYHAINKGFERSTGDVMAWLNSDDMFLPGALGTVAEVLTSFTEVDWVTSVWPAAYNAAGERRWCRRLPGFAAEAFWRAEYVVGVGPWHSAWIPQEATFWRRSLWREAGSHLDDSLQFAGDFELWARFFRQADLVGVNARLGGFRRHPKQKTAVALETYIEEARDVFRRQGGVAHEPGKALARKLVTRLPAILRRRLPGGLSYPGRILTRQGPAGPWQLVDTVV